MFGGHFLLGVARPPLRASVTCARPPGDGNQAPPAPQEDPAGSALLQLQAAREVGGAGPHLGDTCVPTPPAMPSTRTHPAGRALHPASVCDDAKQRRACAFAGWLDDVGLPQYKDQFNEGRVDGRMLQYLTLVRPAPADRPLQHAAVPVRSSRGRSPIPLGRATSSS